MADSFAFRATIFLTQFLGASDSANRALAVNGAFSASSLFASHFTFRTSANRMADSRALRIIALPFANRVALEQKGVRREK